MTRNTDFSMRPDSVASITWYASVIFGWALIATAVAHLATTSYHGEVAALVMTAALVVVLMLLPLVQGHRHYAGGVESATAFICAMLMLWGPWPAVVTVAVASLANDARMHKNWWRKVFNPAQYALSAGAGALVMQAAGVHPDVAHPLTSFGLSDLPWAVGIWLAYFTVNLILVSGVLTFRVPFGRIFLDVHDNAVFFGVFAMSPLVVIVALAEWRLLPLLLVPLTLLYYTAHVSLAREHEATHDALTGLPNRTSLRYSVDAALRRHRHNGTPFGLLLVDMDEFKRVNDTLGHQVGDDLLVRFAERLGTCVRPGDSVARLGGDEFAVVVADAGTSEVRAVAERIRAAMQVPIPVGSLSLDAEVSIGLAHCPTHSADGSTLLRYADVAMYVAKHSPSSIETYSPERDPNSADRLRLLGQLRQALDDNVLELYYQPKVTAQDGAPLGFEALLRWHHPERGQIPPDEFIPLAERSGIMPRLTERVLNLALAQMARWRDQGLWTPVAVNISPTDLTDDHFVEVVAESLRRHDIPASMLQLEITERMVGDGSREAAATLRALRTMGVAISLDDFGTGYSSLQRLRHGPVDELKIDRTFVVNLVGDPAARGIVRAMIELAHALGLPAVAEGVETLEEREVLVGLACDGVQGWQIARPLPEAQATAWLRARGVTRGAHPELSKA